ncbi:hypothetical protein [Wolbachia endosymbiont of Drosophila incompta]|nr:hypothetical protein [Wolbachia endosymbiont of Drosophila incompta]
MNLLVSGQPLKEIIKCEELEDITKKKIAEAKNEVELQILLDDFRKKML